MLLTINDLAKQVISLAGSSSAIEHLSYQEAYGQQFEDMQRRVPDLSRIGKAIGFSAKAESQSQLLWSGRRRKACRSF